MAFVDRYTDEARETRSAAQDAVARKWIERFGLGFHPDTRGPCYDPPLTVAEAAEYDADMDTLFDGPQCPYEASIAMWAKLGLISEAEAG